MSVDTERLDRIEQHLSNLKKNDEEQSKLLVSIQGALIGDKMNGFKAETTLEDLDEVEKWICDKVKELYPQSDFVVNGFDNYVIESKAEVLQIIENLLQMPDVLIDAVQNGNTDYDTEALYKLVTQ